MQDSKQENTKVVSLKKLAENLRSVFSSLKSPSAPMETICMKFQSLFSGKNKKNIINLPSAKSSKLAQKAVKVKLFGTLMISRRLDVHFDFVLHCSQKLCSSTQFFHLVHFLQFS